MVWSFQGISSEVVARTGGARELREVGDRTLASRYDIGEKISVSWPATAVRFVRD